MFGCVRLTRRWIVARSMTFRATVVPVGVWTALWTREKLPSAWAVGRTENSRIEDGRGKVEGAAPPPPDVPPLEDATAASAAVGMGGWAGDGGDCDDDISERGP